MNIKPENNKIAISNGQHILTKIENPTYIEDNTKKQLSFTGIENNEYLFSDSAFLVKISIEQKSNERFYIKRKWINTSDRARKIQTVFRISPCFDVKKYLIPCVNFNGNEYGAGNEPKGLEKDGEKWIFAYDRTSVPACTLVENDELYCALFACNNTVDSLISSCSIFKEGNQFYQEIYHPVTEAPIRYSGRDRYAERYEDFIEIKPRDSFECAFNIMLGKPKWGNYAMSNVLDEALLIYGDNGYIKEPTKSSVWNNSIEFAESLITDYKGKRGFIIGFLPSEAGGFECRKDNCFELAWCGQNILFCRMLIEDSIKNNNKSRLDTALEILDTRVKYCTAESGLMATQLSHFESLNAATADTCNLGYGAYELLRCYKRLKEINIDKPEYLETAKGVCDFFLKNYSSDFGFGKLWSLNGECIQKDGSIGAFVICPLIEIYNITGDKVYLDIAEKAMKFYAQSSLEDFCFTAGALDTCCVDKESSAPFIISSILLYEATDNKLYLEYAQKAAYYFTSWMFHYEPVYSENCDIKKHNVFVKGLTAVSTQHHHLDMYGALVVPYIKKLAKHTGDAAWLKRADMLWRAVLQFIGDGELIMHGEKRPVGSQNEAVFHCNWGFDKGTKGQLNDWLVAWPCAFRLSVLAQEEF